MSDEERKAEYERWFARGQEARRAGKKPDETCLIAMRPGSNAYEGFADGYATEVLSRQNNTDLGGR